MTYNFKLIYPKKLKPTPVTDVLRDLLIPRKWRHLLRINKQVTVNGKYRNFNELIYPNDKIELKINFVDSHQQEYPASKHLPDVVYEDDDLLVINKKKGQKTHPNLFESDTALNDCATYLGKSPYIVHRLDMLTGGLLLVAKNPAVVPILNRELTTKTFHREYLAKVNLNKDLDKNGTISFAIGQDPNDQRKRMVREDGLKAVTHYQVIEKDDIEKTALLKISLETGRTHQIRVHLAAIGCPIVGDPLYNPNFKESEELQLTAYEMSLIKPYTFSRITIQLPKNDF
ncbi:RluA family pseudouridine synthase [Lactobacillus hamsteri]|uniref:RNA pseudouridylate synthase n=1 Tax=Lactobacillus hamsteri DSM 5661 = JCM 6256 TaxID=1423754 RepID=A0A0R1YEF1_9LACO|nr:RluA family pseudouridine synthase [Lactobacillus hamsteri]KRM37926.1 ribosomal large subunit pseudouridine synthase [Lactobacillus hamsteri DSM 5661 = JCM 6256]